MYLESLELLYFKNYEECRLSFSPHINCLTGENGSGKTNLLDAIYYLSLTKSAFHKTDLPNIRQGHDFFMIHGDFVDTAQKHAVRCAYSLVEKKILSCNTIPYERITEHIGRFPVVLIAPDDTQVIREGSEERRKFFDGIIAQTDNHYLHNLLAYNHYLLQRNSLLKQFAERHYFDRDLLEAYSAPLLELAEKIYHKRQDFLQKFEPLFQKHYARLTQSREIVRLSYESQWQAENPTTDFWAALGKDAQLQRSTHGIHRDDYVFQINDFSLKKYGSQGQQKSYLIALKLAQFEAIEAATGHKPILLLDDIFDKLDELRIGQLLQMVADSFFGQIFITDARPERSRALLAHLGEKARFFGVHEGFVQGENL
ncbi:DNA replication and repair protein RecF [Flexibacter flexilis DSM 6793]|uniref:DNA replication and repair protein RecF n=1 Tax=Flexibacter flexilis DSM 6793 TaxID=927664 RepID=A0A1I1E4K4_9BACT|nr:DNA replication/repair protein RecF [Flexibacter flexilis]SFB82044.1 DNA replication and repair protein RecF [Flexibacter flexilis DSM 6793]